MFNSVFGNCNKRNHLLLLNLNKWQHLQQSRPTNHRHSLRAELSEMLKWERLGLEGIWWENWDEILDPILPFSDAFNELKSLKNGKFQQITALLSSLLRLFLLKAHFFTSIEIISAENFFVWLFETPQSCPIASRMHDDFSKLRLVLLRISWGTIIIMKRKWSTKRSGGKTRLRRSGETQKGVKRKRERIGS